MDSNNEISFGLFSSDNFSANNIEIEPFSESDNEINNKEEDIEFIKLDLDEEISQDYEVNDQTPLDEENFDLESEMSENIFEKPIDNDSNNENLVRRNNLKQYNYVFKNKNSTIEDLEKIPAYKRMGIEINDLKTQNEDTFSKTILNEDNKLEFPDVNTYLHDNVD